MKVIFLDIDGVLNHNDWYVKTRYVGKYDGGDVDPKCVELINDLLDATGAKIIMSSSWRSDYENSYEYLYERGLYCDAIVSKTPHFTYTCQNEDIRKTLCRVNEIQYVIESEDITEETMLEILQEVSNDISRMEKRLVEYEKYTAHNTDLITEIIEGKSYLEELVKTKHYVEMIQTLVWNTNHGFNSFKKVCCNIG